MIRRVARLTALSLAALVLGSCGGGGGGGGNFDEDGPIGVFSGFVGNLDWSGQGLGGDGSVGAGGDGDGGVGAGGDFGQFRGAIVRAYRQDGTLIGEAPTDNATGMVTIRPGRTYNGSMCVELRGSATAQYYEEGRDTFVPFPAGRVIRVRVPAINKNIGITPFTEAAYRLLHSGANTDCQAASPSAAQITAANDTVRGILNQQFPRALEVDDITRLPFIKSSAVSQGSIGIGPRGRYGLVNGAFSKQAAMFASGRTSPTLDALEQLSEDLIDGVLDGRRGTAPAVPAERRTYDPNSFTGELSSALAQQADRFGSQAALNSLPKVLNFGNTRYQGYLFDGSIDKAGRAFSTVAGWVADNDQGRNLGDAGDKFPGRAGRTFAFYGNHGHGGGFFKSDATGSPQIFALGDNVNGELGTGNTTSTNTLTVPITLPGELTHAAGGFAHTVARMADGSVYAWGDNSYGQLGRNPATTARSLTPLRVTLPDGAVAVASTNTASFALLENGTVYAWGSSGGFGVLGRGVKNDVGFTPTLVPNLADVVQIAARDNDVLVLRRDNTVWQWGSFPASVDAFTEGDVAGEYRGGRASPTRIGGIPAGSTVRKVLTEQGISVAVLGNGHVYTWGVYFDITAGQILRDTTALRILGLPPVRDLMPGGFNGYGVRAFDRMTAMGIDYRGGMWKLRGRVAEQFDPANPAQQRRPQVQSPRPDCASCHLFLNDWPLTPAAPTSTEICDPYGKRPDIHGTRTAPLVHAETECQQCHNPARQPPIVAFPDGWLACVRPTDLPPRTTLIDPPLIGNSCELPVGHVFTPRGTTCATCHNSIIAEPLQAKGCAQPNSSELPTIPTTVSLAEAFDDAGVPIAAGVITTDPNPEFRGTVNGTLGAGQTVRVLRDGATAGTATVVGGVWTFVDANPGQGTHTWAARVQTASGFGPTSNTLRFSIDTVTPTTAANVTAIRDDVLGAVAANGFASDTTPTISGTLGAALGSGERIELQRDGNPVGQPTVTGTTWTYTEAAPVAAGAHTWRARVVDAAGNSGPFGTTRTATIVASLPTAAITSITNDIAGAIVVPPGGSTPDRTPVLAGTISTATLPAGHVVRVRRGGASVGTATVTAANWSFTDNLAADATVSYTVRVEAGLVLGTASAAYAITVDATAPTQVANATVVSDDFIGDLPFVNAITSDTTPSVRGTLSAALGAGEQVRVMRATRTNPTPVEVARVDANGTAWTYSEPVALPAELYTYGAQAGDAAGNLGPTTGGTVSVTINPGAVPLPGAAVTLVSVNGVPAGQVVVSSDSTPTIAGTIERNLASGEIVRVYRDDVLVGGAGAVGSSMWSFTDSPLADGTYNYRARVEVSLNGSVFGSSSATVAVPIDATPPAQTAAVTAIRDNANFLYVDGGFTADTTPLVQGTVNVALGAGEVLDVLRNGAVVVSLSFGGTGWSYTEPSALIGAGTAALFSYTARVRDAADNNGATSAARTINVVTNLPATTIASVNGLVNGASDNDTSPQVNISLGAALPAGYVVRVLRNGSPLGGALTACNTTCAFTDSISTNTTYNYTARTEAGGSASVVGTALGATSNTRTYVLDTVAPPSPSISGTVNNKPYQNNTADANVNFSSGATVGDPTPQINVSFSSLTGTGEAVALDRWNGSAWVQVTSTTVGTSLAYSQPASFNQPTSQPSGNPGTQFYRARRTDAASNTTTSATFQFGNFYLACSQSRALAKSNNATHTSWPAGTGSCTACHSSPTAAGFIAAPPPTGSGDRYWCSKS